MKLDNPDSQAPMDFDLQQWDAIPIHLIFWGFLGVQAKKGAVDLNVISTVAGPLASALATSVATDGKDCLMSRHGDSAMEIEREQ